MSFRFNENYFIDSMPNILTNDKLRPPQYEAYQAIKKYYEKEEYPNRNALVVLPTGCGKTGVMAIAPFDICKKRTLIITPGNTIRDTVLDSLDPSNANNFWYEYDVFFPGITLPNVIEYESDTTDEVLSVANIVILNIQKLQERLSSSLLNRVDSDFFDFIIIDEAHHSTANTWVNCINYFKDAKILKLTGTPFRTDGEKINGELIYEYPLSRAMYHGYIKSLQNIVYTPDEVKLTIDNDDSKLYTIDEIFNMGLRDQDWVTRSVAFSEECSLKIVDASIEELNKKTSNSNIPHKIIAIACSIKHAKQIAKLYESRNIKTAVIYSDLPIEEKNAIFKDIENHRVQAVINVAMLGEGYDHKYLSIAAIFRPFRAELPYTQFIGRVLRYIPEGNSEDNIAKIVSHHYLYLDKLWEKYKKEISQSEIIKSLRDMDDILDKELDETKDSNPTKPRDQQILGNVTESETYHLNVEDYLDTELIRKSKEAEKQFNEKIKELQTLLGISFEQARGIIYQTNTKSNLGRPDKIYKRKKKDLDETIREEIVPDLITKYNIDSESDDLKDCGLFTGPYWYIPNSAKKNNGMIAMYFNTYLRNKIGYARKFWTDDDFDIAFSHLDKLTNMIEGIIKEYYNL